MVSRDKLKNFPDQLTDRDEMECVALAVTDIAGNILGRAFSHDYTYASTIFMEGIQPGDTGTDPWVGLQSAIAYGLLPSEQAPFTSETMGEQYTSNFANYSPDVRKLALPHQMVALKNIGVDYDAAVSYMAATGNGILLPMTWFSSFNDPATPQLALPSGGTSNHCPAAYLGDDNMTIYIKPWLGPQWKQGGYAPLSRQMFNTIVSRAYAFDQNGNHWLAILSILLTKYPYLSAYFPALAKA